MHTDTEIRHQYFYSANIGIYVEYLFELDHDVFGQFHVLEHPLQLAGEGCSALWRMSKPQNIESFSHLHMSARHVDNDHSDNETS